MFDSLHSPHVRVRNLKGPPWENPKNPNQSTGGLLSPSSWWLNQPHLKIIIVKMGSGSARFGVKIKNYLKPPTSYVFLDVGFLKEVERREPGLGPEGRCECVNTSMI